MVRVLIIIAIFIFISGGSGYAGEAFSTADGIQAYKNGKYEDCITNMKAVVKNDPTSAIGYYYLGLAYAKTGRNILAVQNYNKVISLGSDKTLIDLAQKGKACVGGKKITAIETQLEDIEEEIKENINTPKTEKLSPAELKAKYEQKISKPANENKSGTSTVIKASDYQKANTPPTNDEIVNAIRVLQRAGLLQNGVSGLAGGTQAGFNPEMDSKTQQMNAMLMMMGQNGNNNNGMMNMLPLMNNGSGKINPQMIQMMMMNQMMPNFSTGGNNNGY